MKLLGLNISRASTNKDFIPFNNKGEVIDFSNYLGKTSNFSNIYTKTGQATAYQVVKAIKTVINRRAAAFGNGKVWVLDKKGNEVMTPEARQARDILKAPNIMQTWHDFYLQHKIYKYVFGFCPVYVLKPFGLSTPKAIFNILPLIFDVKTTGKLYNQTKIEDIIEKYIISINGISSELAINDVYLFKDNSLCLKKDNYLPESRLCSLQYDVALNNAISEAEYTMVAKRGALGILSNNSRDVTGMIPLKQEEKDDIQRQYQRYGISNDKNQIIISEADLRWQQIGINTRELMLIELNDSSMANIADAFDYPNEMLSGSKQVTYANKNEAKKQFYQDVVIPEADADAEAFTKLLGLQNCYIKIDFSEMPILQENRKQRAEVLNTTVSALNTAFSANIITIEEYRKELSEIININPNEIPKIEPETNQNDEQESELPDDEGNKQDESR